MTYWILLSVALALVGHAAFWVAVNNRLHATGLPYGVIRVAEKIMAVIVVAVPLGFVWWLWQYAETENGLPLAKVSDLGPWAFYFIPATFVTLLIVPAWIQRQFFPHRVAALVSNHTQAVDVTRELGFAPVGDLRTRIMMALPGNEALSFHLNEKTLALPRWPQALDGLTIVHLSDLHFTGGIRREYFELAVERANACAADLVAVTGDVVDNPNCLPWIAETLGRLRGKYGVFAILGNHDKRKVAPATVRAALSECGIIDLGGVWRELLVHGERVVLAGNELPWFGPTPQMHDAPPALDAGGPPRILLSHSPDQIRWAEANAFDVMLAGHTHGGQIRIPLLGPMVAPSRYGVRYASGVFHEGRTLLHVSRGLSGKDPLRWNCPPELTQLVIKRA